MWFLVAETFSPVVWTSSSQLLFLFVSHQERFAFQPKFQLGRFCYFSSQNLVLMICFPIEVLFLV